MIAHKAMHSPEDFCRRGKEIFAREVQPSLRPEDENKFIAIDIDSSDYEMDKDDYLATERLLARRPQAQIWLDRVGQKAAYRIGRHRIVGGLE